MSSDIKVFDVWAQRITVKSSQNITRLPLAISSIVRRNIRTAALTHGPNKKMSVRNIRSERFPCGTNNSPIFTISGMESLGKLTSISRRTFGDFYLNKHIIILS